MAEQLVALIDANGELVQIVRSLNGIDTTGLTVIENVPEPPYEYEWDSVREMFTPGPAIRRCQRLLDERIDEIRGRYPAPGRYISEEYRITAEQARAYRAAGYSGEVPPTVEAWALAAGITAHEATDDILERDEAYRSLLVQTRRARLLGKAQIAQATTPEQAHAILEAVIAALEDELPPPT